METQEYRRLFQHAPFACLVTDIEGRIREANDEAACLLGVPRPALTGSSFAAFMAVGDPRAIRRTAERLMRPGEVPRAKWVTLLQPRGRAQFPAMVTVAPLAADDEARTDLCWQLCDIAAFSEATALPYALPGQPPIAVQQRRIAATAEAVAALNAEIARHQRTAEALRESEERYRSLAAAVPVGIFCTDAHGVSVYANRRAHEIAGVAPDETVGERCWTEWLHPDDREGVLAAWGKAVAEGGAYRCEQRFRRPDGADVWVYAQLVPQVGGDGEVTGYVGTLTDITDFKRAEEALRRSEQRYRDLVEHASDLIFETDPRGYFTYANSDVVLQILGYTADEIIGTSCLSLVRPDYRATLGAFYRNQFLNRIRKTYFVFPALAKNGREVWFGQHAEMVMEGERLVGFRVICRDVTVQKQVEAELQRTSARLRGLAAHLESVREEQGRRLAAEVHDSLGGNLNMIKLGLASFLEKLDADDPARRRLDSVLALSEEAIRIAREITAQLRPRMLDTLGLVATIRWYAQEFSRVTDIRCDVRLPQFIRLSPERAAAAFRVVQEALTNVARHAGATAVTIEAAKSRSQLLVTIADNGGGIRPADLDKQDSYGILGMNERSQYLGGDIDITATPGQGTTVTLRVPFET